MIFILLNFFKNFCAPLRKLIENEYGLKFSSKICDKKTHNVYNGYTGVLSSAG